MSKKKETQLILGFLCCFLISLTFSAVYKYDNERMTQAGNIRDYQVDSDHTYSWYIDSVTTNEKQNVIEGWAAQPGEDIDYVDRTVVLLDAQGTIYRLNSIMVKRTSVTDYFKDGHNYDNSGFRAAVLFKNLQVGETYTVGIIVKEKDGSNELVKTDKTIVG